MNNELLAQFDKKVCGHLMAKKILINSINRSKLRYHQHFRDSVPLDQCVPSLNCLLIGDSGTGKTHLVETLSGLMHFPLVRFDASCFNPAASKAGMSVKNVGEKVHTTINAFYAVEQKKPQWERLAQSYDGVMHQTIVYIDEFDKMCREYNNSEWHQGTQSEFLTFFENKTEQFQGLTFIFSGAFAKMDRKQSKKHTIGFHKPDQEEFNADNLEHKLIQYGVLPELLGRIGKVVLLDELNEDQYMDILDNMLLIELETHLKAYGIEDYKLCPLKKTEIVKRAKQSKLGVRGLKKEIMDLIVDIEFNTLTMEK